MREREKGEVYCGKDIEITFFYGGEKDQLA
jgi:hypothetical protein